ncbi:MAG: YidC/Oxa1 family membrane protein insertase [bacterium]
MDKRSNYLTILLVTFIVMIGAQIFFTGGKKVQKDPRGAEKVLIDIQTYKNSGQWKKVQYQTQNVMLKDFANTPQAPQALLIEADAIKDHTKVYKTDARRYKDFYNVVKVYQQLKKSYPESIEWKIIGATRLTELTNQIDKHNESLPGYVILGIQLPNQYKVMDMLVGLTNKVPWFSYTFAMLLLAIIVRILLYPLSHLQFKSMKEMAKVQPIMKELQQKFKGEELNKKIMQMYKEHNVNPAMGCFSMLTIMLQIPFFIWVYGAIRQYEFQFTKGTFLWIGSGFSHQFPAFLGANLGVQDVPLLLIYSVTMYISQRLMVMDPAQAEQQKTTSLVMSGVFLVMMFQWALPSAFVLYWIFLNVLQTMQQRQYMLPKTNGEAAIVNTATTEPGSNGKDKQTIEPNDEKNDKNDVTARIHAKKRKNK